MNQALNVKNQGIIEHYQCEHVDALNLMTKPNQYFYTFDDW